MSRVAPLPPSGLTPLQVEYEDAVTTVMQVSSCASATPSPSPALTPASSLLARLRRVQSAEQCVTESDLAAAFAATLGGVDAERRAALTKKIVERIDVNGDGQLSLDRLSVLFEQHPRLMVLLSAQAELNRTNVVRELRRVSSAPPLRASFLVPTDFSSRTALLSAAATARAASKRSSALTYKCLGCGAPTRKATCWLGILCVGIIATMLQAGLRYSLAGNPPAIVLARMGGHLSYFLVAVVIVTMLRRTFALLARFPNVARAVPFDAFASVHMAASWGLIAAMPLHVGGHVTNFVMSLYPPAAVFTAPGDLAAFPALVAYPAIGAVASGIYLLVALGAMASGFLLRNRHGCFAIFHFSHAFGAPLVMGLFALHSPSGWWVLAVPVLLLSVEMLLRFAAAVAAPLEVIALTPLTGGACELRLKRPRWWYFLPGQFVWIRIPALEGSSPCMLRYHPFAISSPAEASRVLTFHIRSAGPRAGWTAALISLARERTAAAKLRQRRLRKAAYSERSQLADDVLPRSPMSDKGTGWLTALAALEQRRPTTVDVPPEPAPLVAWIDGPYPAPCQGVLFADHAILIAAGIGVTPMASIIGSMLARARAAAVAAEAIGDSGASDARSALAPLKRLDIVWLASETSAFGWFIPLLQRFEIEAEHDLQLRSMLHVHVFLTGMSPDTDEGTVLLRFALDAFFADDERDCIIGLNGTIAKPGRPKWPVFLATARHDFVKTEGNEALSEVFFCGPPSMNKELAGACFDADMPFHAEAY